ncbi:hypothetical protein EJ05DRAFT_530615 [Pseudovirgaria hyperparasitica]|uniref:Thioredoxin reductase n=1 Tax=Pseudovirgaria hyperparasitica TaxID=470096 RepID=A0A6A6WD74_9PEZI|nr:uncharacterized protein EJ05DRAFT_530615 [Pseudovirgaria hyperparasitica]KAF2760782.1 hypothetical protein EJ05DRAFT_530615 [Pseudovirgaria hyperparasitica]
MAEDVSQGKVDLELPPLDNRLVASAAARLDAAKIPHVLWGNYMLTIFGIPTIVDGIDFVIDDDFMDAAYHTLQGEGFKECKSEGCISKKNLGYAPTPHNHLHITESLSLGFYKKSDILWRLPNLLNVDGETIILASDLNQLPGPDILGRGGRFQQDLHPVRVLAVYQLVPALLLLAKKDMSTYGRYWMNWISYILEYCTENGVFDQNRLTGIYKTYINAFLEGDYTAKHQAFACIGITE